MISTVFLCLLVLLLFSVSDGSNPNIIFLTIDDWGYSDLSARGGEFATPNLDELYKESIVLNNHYVGISMCSPSRSQFLVGRYVWNMGLSDARVFKAGEALGIPPALPTIGNLLKEHSNYKTYVAGKWHVGYGTEYHTPLQRGFDEFYGFLTTGLDYTQHTMHEYLDWWNNNELDYHTVGVHSTLVTEDKIKQIIEKHGEHSSNENEPFYIYAAFQALHKELQLANSDNVDNYCNRDYFDEEDEIRYIYCTNLVSLDESIGNVVDKLKENKMWDNTLIVLTSDNGAGYTAGGCNHPLRGGKFTYFDGGSKVITFVAGGYIPKDQRGTERNGFFHGADWVPTLLSIANVNVNMVRDDLQNKLYQKIAHKVSASVNNHNNIDSLDGMDLSQWLLHGDHSDIAIKRDTVPLAISTISDTSEGSVTSNDNVIVFRSQLTNNIYKFMYFATKETDNGHSKTKGERCFYQDVTVTTDNGEEITVKQRSLRTDGNFGKIKKLLFDLTLDRHESKNLMENIDMDMHENSISEGVTDYLDRVGRISDYKDKNDLILALWNEAIDLIKEEYIENNPLFHDFIGCVAESDNVGAGRIQTVKMDSWQPFLDWEEYVNGIKQHCSVNDESTDSSVSDINSMLLELFTTKYEDYSQRDEAHIFEYEFEPVQTSCVGLEDGTYHYFELESAASSGGHRKFNTVYAKCSNDYILIDYRVDSDWKHYFSSWKQWHRTIVGASKNDLVNWQEWFLPDSGSNSYDYATAYDCSICDNRDVLSNGIFKLDSELINNNIGYYMNGSTFGCNDKESGLYSCDMSYDGSNVCHTCSSVQWGTVIVQDWEGGVDPTLAHGNCYVSTLPVDHVHYQTWDKCSQFDSGFSVNPSMGIGGDHCVCVKPNQNGLQRTQRIRGGPKLKRVERKKSNLDRINKLNDKQIDADVNDIDSNIVYLSQKDFAEGTYRITKSGTYIITEDIIFDFNRPSNYDDKMDYSANEENIWWPRADQTDIYEGADDVAGAYMLGFFAGITVETSNVVIDLNGKELKMSKEYYYQQPFWATIEISSQVFLPGQGIGFFGPNPVGAKNLVIKNGNLGLSSHHCIHGIEVENVEILNVNCYDFTTHGIQINGFNGLTLDNVDIGGNININYLSADYSNMRVLLPRLRMTALDYGDSEIEFKGKGSESRNHYGRIWTFIELLDELVYQMDFAYKFAMCEGDLTKLSEIYDMTEDEIKDDESFQSALEMFVNFDENGNLEGIPFGGVMYGLILKNSGSAIPSYVGNSETDTTYNLVLNNVNVHDLTHATTEFVYLKAYGRQTLTNPLNANLKNSHFWSDKFIDDYGSGKLQSKDWDEQDPDYIGSIVSDVLIAMGSLTLKDNNYFAAKGLSTINSEVVSWAVDGNGFYSDSIGTVPGFQCNGDPMLHINKGIIGIRLSGINNVELSNVNVYNLHESGGWGSEFCGKYQTSHLRSMQPYYIGYTGNRVQGVSTEFCTFNRLENVNVDTMVSDTGLSYGIQFYPGTVVNWQHSDSIAIRNLIAGKDNERVSKLIEGSSIEIARDSLPNMLPKACGIKVTPMSMRHDTISFPVTFNGFQNVHNMKSDVGIIVNVECVSNMYTICDDENEIETELGHINMCMIEDTVYSEKLINNAALTGIDQYVEASDKLLITFLIMCLIIIFGVAALVVTLAQSNETKYDKIFHKRDITGFSSTYGTVQV